MADPHRVDVSTHEEEHEQSSRTNTESRDSANSPTVRDARTPVEVAAPEPRVRRSLEEPSVINSSHEFRASASPAPPGALFGLVCNWVAALMAVGAALAAGRRRRCSSAIPTVAAEVLHLPRPLAEDRRMSRAA
jgi:hypothetical protein